MILIKMTGIELPMGTLCGLSVGWGTRRGGSGTWGVRAAPSDATPGWLQIGPWVQADWLRSTRRARPTGRPAVEGMRTGHQHAFPYASQWRTCTSVAAMSNVERPAAPGWLCGRRRSPRCRSAQTGCGWVAFLITGPIPGRPAATFSGTGHLRGAHIAPVQLCQMSHPSGI